MRRIREILRLRAELGPNLSAIAAGAKVARSTVRIYLGRAAAAGLDGANTEGLSEEALEAALFPPPAVAEGRLPDWAAVDQELRRNKHVTRKLLWLEYKLRFLPPAGLMALRMKMAPGIRGRISGPISSRCWSFFVPLLSRPRTRKVLRSRSISRQRRPSASPCRVACATAHLVNQTSHSFPDVPNTV